MTGCTERGTDELIDGVLLVGVCHDDAVVLGAHVALHSLAVLGSSVENVVPCFVSS